MQRARAHPVPQVPAQIHQIDRQIARLHNILSQAASQNIAQFTLSNGLSVVVVPDHRTPVVTHMIWYCVGSGDETLGNAHVRW